MPDHGRGLQEPFPRLQRGRQVAPPARGAGVRVDTHLYPGYTVPPFYDALLAKLVVWAPTRPEAIARTRRALQEFQVDGLKTTIPFHIEVMANAYFRRGEVATNFIIRRMGLT